MEFAKEIHGAMLKIMKSILDMAEFKWGKESLEFKYFKKEIMSLVYSNERGLFERMNHGGLLVKCKCGANVKHGYSSCEFCGGSGYRNAEK